MTVIICSNEYDLLWVYDDRLPQRRFAIPSTPIGTYCSIAAAFVGDPLEVVYLQETESKKILVADPKWMGILPHLGINLGDSHNKAGILFEYPDFVSPYASAIKLTASDFLLESQQSNFDMKVFLIKAWIRYDLKPSQVNTAIRYAKKIDDYCASNEEFFFRLDSIFEGIKDIETLYLSEELARINVEIDSSAPLVEDLVSKTSQISNEILTFKDYLKDLEHITLDNLGW